MEQLTNKVCDKGVHIVEPTIDERHEKAAFLVMVATNDHDSQLATLIANTVGKAIDARARKHERRNCPK